MDVSSYFRMTPEQAAKALASSGLGVEGFAAQLREDGAINSTVYAVAQDAKGKGGIRKRFEGAPASAEAQDCANHLIRVAAAMDTKEIESFRLKVNERASSGKVHALESTGARGLKAFVKRYAAESIVGVAANKEAPAPAK